MTPLCGAAMCGNTKVAILLLNRGANIEAIATEVRLSYYYSVNYSVIIICLSLIIARVLLLFTEQFVRALLRQQPYC